MRLPIKKGKFGSYVYLPEELSAFSYVELFKLKDGFYLLSLPLDLFSKPSKKEIAELLKKLVSIKFEKRTPPEVSKQLNAREKSVLEYLVNKGFVEVFYGGKYKRTGVYNIPKKVFSQIERMKITEMSNNDVKTINKTKSQQTKFYFSVFTKKSEAAEFSRKREEDIKNGKILAIRGFDGKYYAISKDLFEKISADFLKFLSEEKPISEITSGLPYPHEQIQAVIYLLLESGDIIEKRKGVYERI